MQHEYAAVMCYECCAVCAAHLWALLAGVRRTFRTAPRLATGVYLEHGPVLPVSMGSREESGSRRVCPVCQSGAVEDEVRVLLHCAAYENLRCSSGLDLSGSMRDILLGPEQAKLAVLLGQYGLRGMPVYRSHGERLDTCLQYIRLRVVCPGVDPGAPGSYTGPYILGSGSYHVKNKQLKWALIDSTPLGHAYRVRSALFVCAYV